MPSIAIVDSGPLIASANRADPDHAASLEALRTPGLHLVIPALCVAEVAYLLATRRGPSTEAAFVRGLEGFDVRAPLSEDWPRIAELVDAYADLGLGTVDASVVALAERLRTDVLLTLDRRHFTTVRPAHCERFRLLPES
ncbi:MAG: PIN domain-containing protein [Thermoanaerobaculia bacterium]